VVKTKPSGVRVVDLRRSRGHPSDRIRDIITRRAIRMVAQPIVDLQTSAVVGYEALARFAAEPLCGPEWWFDQAGRVGLRTELELEVVRAAILHARLVPRPLFVSINASPTTVVDPEFRAAVLSGPTDRIVVEVTEHQEVKDYEPLEEAIIFLRSFAVRIAVDDVGAGFASMQHVLHLAPEILKLDRSLTIGIERNEAKQALIASLVRFGSTMGMTLVAEGIESRAQLDQLGGLSVHEGQGFYLGPPEPFLSVVGWQPPEGDLAS